MVGSVEEKRKRLLRELGDVERFLKEEAVVREHLHKDLPGDTVFDGGLEPLGGGRYRFSGSVKHPDGGVLEFENAVLEKTDKGYVIEGTAKKLAGTPKELAALIPLDEEVQPATREDIRKHARVSTDYKVRGKLVGKLYRVRGEELLVDDKHKVIARGRDVSVVGGGYTVKASKSGRVRGVVEVGGEKYETKNPDEVLLVVPGKVVARGRKIDVEDGSYRVEASESVPGVVEVGDKTYKAEKPWEELLVDPKEKVVARGWKIDVRDGGYWVEGSIDVPGVVEVGGEKYETKNPDEVLLVVPGKVVARGRKIDVGDGGYWVEASEGVPAVVEVGGKKYEIYRNGEKLFFDPKTGVVARGWKIDVRDDGYWVRASEDVPGVVEVGGKAYKTEHPGEELFFDPKTGVVARGWDFDVRDGGYWVKAYNFGIRRVRGVVEVGGKKYEIYRDGEQLFVDPKTGVVARGWDFDVRDGGYWVRAFEGVPGVVEVGGKKYEIYRDGEQLFFDPKTGVVARGWDFDVRDGGYWVKALKGVPGVVEVGGKKYTTYRNGEQLFFDPKTDVVARGSIIGRVGGGYLVRASEDGSIKGVIEIGDKTYETKNPDEVLLVAPEKKIIATGHEIISLRDGYLVKASEDGKVPGFIMIGDAAYRTTHANKELFVTPDKKIIATGGDVDIEGVGYRVKASREGSVPAVVEVDGMRFENDKGFKILKTKEGYKVKPL